MFINLISIVFRSVFIYKLFQICRHYYTWVCYLTPVTKGSRRQKQEIMGVSETTWSTQWKTCFKNAEGEKETKKSLEALIFLA